MQCPDPTPLLAWYDENARALPWRATRDPYAIWVSEIMLQQTRVEAVLPYYARFLARLPDVAALAACEQGELLKLWEGLGYYSRVRNMQRAAQTIMSAYGGRFPDTYDGILALPGIGAYTAGAIASFAFDLPYPAVDGNVLRVAARLCNYGEDVLSPVGKRTLTAAVAGAQPPADAARFNQAMIELGATVCLPANPRCAECPLADRCAAHTAGTAHTLPVRKKAAPRRIQRYTVLILRAGDRVALRQRPAKGLLAGLYEPLCLEGHLDARAVEALLCTAGGTPRYITPLGEAKHIFTHIEWHMQGFEVVLDGENALTVCKNLSPALFLAQSAEINAHYALPSAFDAYRAFL